MPPPSKPEETLSILDAVAIIVGVVVGVGIFKTPSIVASVSGSGAMFILFWLLGGLLSLIGALCYAELASTYPDAGGDYHFLKRAFGRVVAFLFAWSRMTVIQSGSIAMIAFLAGDYAAEIFSFGPASNAVYAMVMVAALTSVNLLGVNQGKRTQNLLIGMIVFGILTAALLSVLFVAPVTEGNTWNAATILPGRAALGFAMIFVLLTYGGWNEAAFISAEVKSKERNMGKILILSIAVITGIYLLVNIALLRGLGLTAMAGSDAVVGDLMKKALGPEGALLITVLILIAALSTANGTIITGARTNYALGRDHSIFRFLGEWQGTRGTPANALLVQAAIAMMLILFGARSRNGFVAMVEYMSPVFWLFLSMVAVAVFVLRSRHPETRRPFSVPFYPITPLVFCLACLYMFHSSLVYTGKGSLAGLGVLLAGIPVLLLQQRREKAVSESPT
jgi:basic amino acid/polyamine antiporter, APA family